MIRAGLLWVALALAAPVAAAGDPAAEIAAASGRVEEAREALEAAGATPLPGRIDALAGAIGGYQTALNALGRAVAAAAAREETLAVDLEARRDEAMRLLAALETMTRAPVPDTGLHPQGPLASARAAAVMERLEPALAAEAERLGRRITDLEAARELRRRGEAELGGGLARLAEAQVALSARLAEAIPVVAAEDAPTLTLMARDSETLTQLAAALAGASGAPAAPAAAPPGPMLWPVTGEVVGRFNQADGAGVRRPGLVIAAAPLALVRAPADALVRYAGPFLEYGYVAVLEPEAGTMVVLAGMAQLRARTGETVKRGALVGLLGGRPPDIEESVMAGGEDGAGPIETLYIEVRHGRGPVDPEPLLLGENG